MFNNARARRVKIVFSRKYQAIDILNAIRAVAIQPVFSGYSKKAIGQIGMQKTLNLRVFPDGQEYLCMNDSYNYIELCKYDWLKLSEVQGARPRSLRVLGTAIKVWLEQNVG